MSTRIVIATVIASAAVTVALFAAQEPANDHHVRQADLDRWKTELSNWGRWGKDDQKGTINLITPERRKRAAALVKDGFAVSLARDANTEKAVDNPQPYEDVMTNVSGAAALDRIAVSYHGYAHTHFDGLAHHFMNGKMYNGYPQKNT